MSERDEYETATMEVKSSWDTCENRPKITKESFGTTIVIFKGTI